jgi:hypothetical protein
VGVFCLAEMGWFICFVSKGIDRSMALWSFSYSGGLDSGSFPGDFALRACLFTGNLYDILLIWLEDMLV